jgi:hypothetical protein
MERLRAGVQRIENGVEIPSGAKEFVSKSGRKCYLSGIDFEKKTASVRYIDTGEFADVKWDLIVKYIT